MKYLDIASMLCNELPFELGEELTLPRQIGALQSAYNSMVDEIENLQKKENMYTDTKIDEILEIIENFKNSVKDGSFLQDGSVTIDKMATSLVDEIRSLVIKEIDQAVKIVIPSIDETGHYCLVIPSKWDQIDFDFPLDGHLEIIVKDD